MQTEEILLYFKGVRGGEGKYMALCPTHEDHNPSLSISAKDGITFEDLRNLFSKVVH